MKAHVALCVFAATLIACGDGGPTASSPSSPGTPARLTFVTQPSDVEGNEPIAPVVQVAVLDGFGNTVTTASDPVTVQIGANPGEGALIGSATVSPRAGIATFADLRVDRPGSGYTLAASSGTLVGVESAAFAIRLTFADVSAGGGGHTCGVTRGGSGYCWGSNSVGQLGDGTTVSKRTPALVVTTAGLAFAAVNAGNVHTCSITRSGAAYCWGFNEKGQLGDRTLTERTVPVPVFGQATFVTLSAGYDHTCGVALGGTVCWGNNASGELGDGTRIQRTTPDLVRGLPALAAVSAGAFFTCGVTTAGAGFCWGRGGSLGDGSTTFSDVPVAVSGGLTFVALSSGSLHSCGVTPTGAAYCWGYNGNGELGDGTTIDRTSPVIVAGGITFVGVSAGHLHSCGVTSGGAAYCWGNNTSGQLGDGTTLGRTTPTLVAAPAGVRFAVVSAGAHSCGVTPTGAAYCWGYNRNGELGNGSMISSDVPVRVVQ